MSSGLVRSVRTNELQRKKLEKYLTNSKVRLVRTNELQQGAKNCNSQDWHRCAPCAPMNYNGYQPAITDLLGKVRFMRTNELQHRLRSRHSRQNWCASCAPTNCNMYEVFKTPARLRGALRAHQ